MNSKSPLRRSHLVASSIPNIHLFLLSSNSNVSLHVHELQGLVAILTKEVEMVANTRLQLAEAVTQLNSAREALTTAQASISVHAQSHQAMDSAASGAVNEMRQWFDQYATGPGADKWSGYLDAYHRHFDRFRAQDRITLVEVGVQSGGSIEMWRSYFGAEKLKCVAIPLDNNYTKCIASHRLGSIQQHP